MTPTDTLITQLHNYICDTDLSTLTQEELFQLLQIGSEALALIQKVDIELAARILTKEQGK